MEVEFFLIKKNALNPASKSEQPSHEDERKEKFMQKKIKSSTILGEIYII